MTEPDEHTLEYFNKYIGQNDIDFGEAQLHLGHLPDLYFMMIQN
mgnify:CR=1 FL=1|jgi:hypothetical protein